MAPQAVPLYAWVHVKGGSTAAFRRFASSTLRGFCALYLLAFFATVAFASHRHANGFEDLLIGGPSDSGVFVGFSGPSDFAADSGAGWSSAAIVDDDPCLACFHNDRETETIAFLDVVPTCRPVSIAAAARRSGLPSVPVRSASSRAPPAAS